MGYHSNKGFLDPHVAFQVEFEDGTELRTKRDKIYARGEQLPKRVQSRMVSILCIICNDHLPVLKAVCQIGN